MRPKSRLDAVTGVVGDAAGALRRRRVARRPYAKLYDESGDVEVLDPDGERAQALHDTAASMVEAVAPGGRGSSEEA